MQRSTCRRLFAESSGIWRDEVCPISWWLWWNITQRRWVEVKHYNGGVERRVIWEFYQSIYLWEWWKTFIPEIEETRTLLLFRPFVPSAIPWCLECSQILCVTYYVVGLLHHSIFRKCLFSPLSPFLSLFQKNSSCFLWYWLYYWWIFHIFVAKDLNIPARPWFSSAKIHKSHTICATYLQKTENYDPDKNTDPVIWHTTASCRPSTVPRRCYCRNPLR